MSWYLAVWKSYAVFDGRARRSEFWYFTLFNLIALIVLAIIGRAFGSSGSSVLIGLYLLASFLPGLAVTVRRLHDTNRSGWLVLLSFIPLIGSIVLLVFEAQNGTPGPNAYGPNPKDASGTQTTFSGFPSTPPLMAPPPPPPPPPPPAPPQSS